MDNIPSSSLSWTKTIDAIQILSCFPDPVFITDSQLRITYFNPQAEKLTGLRASHAAGMYCRDVVKGHLCAFGCPVKKILRKRSKFTAETWIRTEAGRIPVLLSASSVYDKAGNTLGYFCVLKDISDFKSMLNQLERSKVQLSERNTRLARALKELRRTHRQLLQAQKMESIGVLAGGIAHDFNNLLSGILGYTSLILQQVPEGSPVYNFAKIVETSALRASSLTKQLLLFGRKGGYEYRVCDINGIIKETILILERTLTKTIDIQVSLAEDIPLVKVNSSQIEQVLMNLCINAMDAMEGVGILKLSSRRATSDDMDRLPRMKRRREYICISISDTGPGIPDEIKDRIFDPFFTTKEEGKGTGLGLAIVYGVVKEHGGFIEVLTEQGKGTCFNIYLPVAKEKLKKSRKTRQEILESRARGHETVLLVDDEEMIRTLVKTVLEEQGYNVIVASDGLDALDIFAKHKDDIDLVLMDSNMPRMGGLEAAMCLKEQKPNLKIIICSGYSMDTESSREKANISRVSDAFLLKPFKVEELLSVIRHTLDYSS